MLELQDVHDHEAAFANIAAPILFKDLTGREATPFLYKGYEPFRTGKR
jgi:hypothetical protein